MLTVSPTVQENFSSANQPNRSNDRNAALYRIKYPHLSRDLTDHGPSENGGPPPTSNEVSLVGLDLKKETDRLKTYEKWMVRFMNKSHLAQSGFYFFGDGDKVRCYFCKLELWNWEEGDDPAADHERWNPTCPLLRGISLNIPLARSGESPPPSGGGRDVCGTYDEEPSNGPVRPSFALESARLESFKDWPCRMKQSPAQMADAGFYYTGSGDKTVCYYCGGGLKDWEDDDDPWEQHAQWFPKCHYIRIVKGDDFICRVRSKAADRNFDSSKEKEPSSPTTAEAAPENPPPTETSSETPEKKSTLCILCCTEERNTCFVPCGHVVACPKCALSIQNCPVCRQRFTSTVRLYYS